MWVRVNSTSELLIRYTRRSLMYITSMELTEHLRWDYTGEDYLQL